MVIELFLEGRDLRWRTTSPERFAASPLDPADRLVEVEAPVEALAPQGDHRVAPVHWRSRCWDSFREGAARGSI